MEYLPQLIGALALLASTLLIMVSRLFKAMTNARIKTDRAERENKKRLDEIESRREAADVKREEIFNARYDKLDKRNEELSKQLTQALVENGESRGKILVLMDHQKSDRDTWKKQRSELVEKIEQLERRIAELEHEKRSQFELIMTLRKERDALQRQLKERDQQVFNNAERLNEYESKLKDCEKEKEHEKVVKLPQPKPSEPTEKSDNDDDNKEKDIA